MIAVDGIILVLSCQKHLPTRIKHLKLPKTEYAGWKVIYVIGDMFLDRDYKFIDDFLIIKCEDSYIHLLKKCRTRHSYNIGILFEICQC